MFYYTKKKKREREFEIALEVNSHRIFFLDVHQSKSFFLGFDDEDARIVECVTGGRMFPPRMDAWMDVLQGTRSSP